MDKSKKTFNIRLPLTATAITAILIAISFLPLQAAILITITASLLILGLPEFKRTPKRKPLYLHPDQQAPQKLVSRRSHNQEVVRENYKRFVEQHSQQQPTQKQYTFSKYLLDEIEWRRFEKLCKGYYESLGYVVSESSIGADGGIDLYIHDKSTRNKIGAAQCKSWSSSVGVKIVREMLGIAALSDIPNFAIITNNEFTQDAIALAKQSNRITLIDGNTLLKHLNQLSKDTRQTLYQIATCGDYTTPTCANCDIKLVKRTAKKDNKEFWGCKNYPSCKFNMKLKANGHAPN